jgi:deoxyribonuclease-4
MGLSAFEYSFGHGVRMSEDTAEKIRQEAEKYHIAMSVHAPYYINLAAGEDALEKNLSYIEQSARAARMLGADRVVIHPGSVSRMIRENAFANTYKSLSKILTVLSEKGYNDILYCPETLGKINQIGDISEIAKLCGLGDNVYPTIDFAHLHARSLGGIRNKEDYIRIIDFLENEVGKEKTKNMHVHFSKVEFTQAGEKMHRIFSDEGFGPDFGPLAEILAERERTPRIICESRGTQASDAKAMMEIYDEKSRERLSRK